MKSTFTFLIAIIIANTIFCQEWIEFTTSETTVPTYNLSKSFDTIVEFDLMVPGMFSTAIDSFNRVQIKEHLKLDSVGYPEIPIVSFLVAIPECDSVKLEISLLDSIKIDDIFIYPAPVLVPDTVEGGAIALVEQFAYNRTAYETDSYFPGYIAETIDKGAIRAQNVVRVLFYPVQFNPVKHEAWVYSKVNINLTFYNPNGSINKDVGIFNEVVGNTLINYNSNGLNASVSCGAGMDNAGTVNWFTELPNQMIDSACDYLIITHQNFYNDPVAKNEIDSLAYHRANFNGFDVAITTRAAILDAFPDPFQPVYEKFFGLIFNTYFSNNANHTYDGKLAYVNLFGDVELQDGSLGVPTYSAGYDVYFTQLTYDSITGNYDIYPDIMIGRCSVDDTNQVKNVVHKILHFKPEDLDYKYEMLTNFYFQSGKDYYCDVLLDMDCYIDDNYNKQLMSPPDLPCLNTLNWNIKPHILDTLIDSYGNGLMFLNYFGHGGVNKWWCGDFSFYYSDLNESCNQKLPFILSYACLTGAFQSADDCMAEQFVSADSIKGAIGFVGATVEIAGSYDMVPVYYESLFNNSASVIGESILETKIKVASFLQPFNLYGDPALNILYENTDTVLPDLYVKNLQIIHTPEYPVFGDTIYINAYVRNNLCNEVNDDFYVSCKICDTHTGDTLWVGNELLEGLDGYGDNVDFTWVTDNISPYDYRYEIIIETDTSNSIPELNEDNNISTNGLKIYSYNNSLYYSNQNNKSSHPVCFDLYPEYDAQEIVFGENIISSSGNNISSISGESKSLTSISNLLNNNSYQVIQEVHFSDDSAAIISRGESQWNYNLSPNTGYGFGPIVDDLNSDGFEEVLFLEKSILPRLVALNYNGTERWSYLLDNFFSRYPVVFSTTEKNIAIIKNITGQVFLLKENENGNSVSVFDSITIPNTFLFFENPIASDINNNGDVEILVYIKDFQMNKKLYILSTDPLSITDSLNINNGYSPILSDVNNDGNEEILMEIAGVGILILNNNLDTLDFIYENNIEISELVSADFNNDGKNDIVFQTNENIIEHYLNIYDYEGNIIFKTPIIGDLSKCWISDIDKNGENEIFYSAGQYLFSIDVPYSGSSIGWPGQQGNVRNTGVLEQPAYFASLGDTVYWTNTISLAGDNILPAFSTVVIKPGTRIKVHAGGSLVVQGTLIAEGTENHPITFSADINGAGNDYWQGITVSNFSVASFAYCNVSDAEVGILVEDENNINISYCRFDNNIVGIGAFNSSPVIYENFITNNITGIHSWKNAAPVLTDFDKNNPFRNGIIDNQTGIKIYEANVYLKYGFNDIYNISGGEYYIYLNQGIGAIQKIHAEYNYWGTTNIDLIFDNLYPSEYFIIEPICPEAQSPYSVPSGIPGDMLKSAYNSMENEEYENAENTFKNIIAEFPATGEAYLSVSGLYENTDRSNGNWNDMETYLSGLYNDSTYSIEFQKLAFGYLNLCKRKQSKFAEAIANYESVILNDPTYNDSVYAVIDIGNTYEEAGNYKSTLGQLSYLVPVSRVRHVEKTVDLLLSLKTEEIKPVIEQKGFTLGQNYPNPFDNTTIIKYSVPYRCRISFDILDVLGRNVKKQNEGIKMKGEQTISVDLSGFSTGVYYYVLKADDKVAGVRKMVVK